MSKVIRLTTYGDVFVEDKTLDEMRKSFDFANYRFCEPLGLSYLYEDGCPDTYEHNVWADLLLNDLCNMNDVYIFCTKHDEYDGLSDLTDDEIEKIITRVRSISTDVKSLRPLYDNLEDNIDKIRCIINRYKMSKVLMLTPGNKIYLLDKTDTELRDMFNLYCDNYTIPWSRNIEIWFEDDYNEEFEYDELLDCIGDNDLIKALRPNFPHAKYDVYGFVVRRNINGDIVDLTDEDIENVHTYLFETGCKFDTNVSQFAYDTFKQQGLIL